MGAPKGNTNARNKNKWRSAIDTALKKYENKTQDVQRGKALYRIAYRLVHDAIEGDQFAIKEIGDRLDGKPSQAIEATENHNITMIQRVVMTAITHEQEAIEGSVVRPAIEENSQETPDIGLSDKDSLINEAVESPVSHEKDSGNT